MLNAPDQAYQARLNAINENLVRAARDAMAICGEFDSDAYGLEFDDYRLIICKKAKLSPRVEKLARAAPSLMLLLPSLVVLAVLAGAVFCIVSILSWLL